MKDKSFEELRDQLAEERRKIMEQPPGRILHGSMAAQHVRIGWDACSKLFLQKHSVVVGMAKVLKNICTSMDIGNNIESGSYFHKIDIRDVLKAYESANGEK